ncbi:hypothetical protein EVAR_88629_1 [Eumeta japonica]|uniref:Uncharacterized protein n=1 Tax=Eumeta variegata TaxID=151549 RepID=A0A4C1X1P3_EUMVA|nr:hypothetical protein EVAR_88629_1 [Eumeta japonica]
MMIDRVRGEEDMMICSERVRQGERKISVEVANTDAAFLVSLERSVNRRIYRPTRGVCDKSIAFEGSLREAGHEGPLARGRTSSRRKKTFVAASIDGINFRKCTCIRQPESFEQPPKTPKLSAANAGVDLILPTYNFARRR